MRETSSSCDRTAIIRRVFAVSKSTVKLVAILLIACILLAPIGLSVVILPLNGPSWDCPGLLPILLVCFTLTAVWATLTSVKSLVQIGFCGDVSERKLRQLPRNFLFALLAAVFIFLTVLFQVQNSKTSSYFRCDRAGLLEALIALIGILGLEPRDALDRISTQISPSAAAVFAFAYLAVFLTAIIAGLKLRDLLQGQKYLAALASKHEVIASLHSSLLPLVINFELPRDPAPSLLKRLWRRFFVPQRLVWVTSPQLAQYASTLRDSSATPRNRDALPTIVRLDGSLNESLLRAGVPRASKTYVEPSLYDRVKEFALSSRVSDARRCPNSTKNHLKPLPVSKLVQLSAARLAGEISLEANTRSVDLFVIPSNNTLVNENHDKSRTVQAGTVSWASPFLAGQSASDGTDLRWSINRSESIVFALAEFTGWLAIFLARKGCSVSVRGEHSMTGAIETFYEEQRDLGLRIWNTRFQTGERLWKVGTSGSDASTARGSSDSRDPGSVEARGVKLIDLCYDGKSEDRAATGNTDGAQTLRVFVREDGARITEYVQAVGGYHYDLLWPGVSINQLGGASNAATRYPIQKPAWAFVSRNDIDDIAKRESK